MTAAPLPRPRQVGVTAARASVLVVTAYMAVVIVAILSPEPDRWLVPLWCAAVAAGVVFHARPRSSRARMAWLILVTVCALGRSMTLMFVGADYLSRSQEVAASLSWMIVWLCSVLAALVLTADALIRGR